MVQRTSQDSSSDSERVAGSSQSAPEVRERTVGSMVSASLLAVLGTLIFAWALRSPDYPWLFAVGAIPWVIGVLVFARALWRYTHL